MKKFRLLGREILLISPGERPPLILLGDAIDEACAAQRRGDASVANRIIIRGLAEIAQVIDPKNRNRIGLKTLRSLLGEALEIDEQTQAKVNRVITNHTPGV